MNPEGELRVALRTAGGRVAACELVSSRPDVARLLLQGRRAAEVQAALPRLFSVCGVSQGVAGALALQAAAGALPDATALAEAGAVVAAESLRMGAQRVLLEWPRLLDESPPPAALAALRAGAPEALAAQIFGGTAAAWLALDTPARFLPWVQAGATPAARVLRSALAAPAAPAGPLLQAAGQEAALRAWALASMAEHEAPAGPPQWQGAAAETGPLARSQADPLLQALAGAGLPPACLRLVARLRELAALLAGRPATAAAAGALALGPGLGLGWVENTRGLLLHLARREGEAVPVFRIVAPTDWNFHPQGALPAALVGASAADGEALRRRALWEVASLDPCVACRVELSHA